MNIINEQIEHLQFGNGKVIGQETDTLSVQFSEQYGVKQFLYPDAFENFLKLSDSKVEVSVMKELHDKQARAEAEKLRKKQEYASSVENILLEKARLAAEKKKPSTRSKVTKTKIVSEPVDSEENKE